MTVPRADDITSIAVLGFGTMGHTWATALLTAGLQVRVFEANDAVVESNRPKTEKYLHSLKKRGKWDGDVTATMARLDFFKSEDELLKTEAPVVLEVVFENMQLKCDLFAKLGAALPQETVFWSNTSCLDIEKMAVASGRPERFIGTHGMNPVHLMQGVEIVRHPQLNPEVLELTLEMVRRMNKQPFVTDNVPGFIVNNGLIPWMIHYFHMLERGQATTADIDIAIKTSLGHPQGVLQLTDFIGINTTILVAEELYAATLDPRYKLPRFIYAMREAGHDGFKTGRGFYDWGDQKNPKPIDFANLTT